MKCANNKNVIISKVEFLPRSAVRT